MTSLYINKGDMLAELVTSQQQGTWTPALTRQMMLLAAGVARHEYFKRFNPRDDLVQNGLLHLLEVWRNFDTTRTNANPFAYFSRCLFRAYAAYTAAEYQQSNIRQSLREVACDWIKTNEHE